METHVLPTRSNLQKQGYEDPQPRRSPTEDLNSKPTAITPCSLTPMVHQVTGTDPGASVALAMEPVDLSLFDFTHHPGDDDIAFQFHL